MVGSRLLSQSQQRSPERPYSARRKQQIKSYTGPITWQQCFSNFARMPNVPHTEKQSANASSQDVADSNGEHLLTGP